MVLKKLGLNPRQRKALIAARAERRLTTALYQEWTEVSRATAKRDLDELVQKGVLIATGAGRGAGYEISVKRLKNGSIDSSAGKGGNGS
jgi:predicted DNA-binding transcriptional regulator YafY